jgi:hypothetical protein
MDGPKIAVTPEQIARAKEMELERKKEQLAKVNFAQIPGLIPDHHIKGLQMMEDPSNDPRLTEWTDSNAVKMASRAQAQGEAFNDDMRIRAVQILEEKMISHKRKGRAELQEATKAAAVGEFSPEGGEGKKPGLLERIRGKL